MIPKTLTIKGIRQGLLITLSEGEWGPQLDALGAYLSANPAFFRGGRVALDVGARRLNGPEIRAAAELLAHHEVELWAVLSTDPTTEAAVQELGLVIDLGPSAAPPAAGPAAEDELSRSAGPLADGLVIRRTLRSGQILRHPGHIVVIGDVNPGAEVVAGGDIVVWGRVRGLVHAGALGEEGAVICALDLAPTQLRIAGHIARSPDERRSKPVPEIAMVRDERIVAEPWSAGW